MNKLLLPWAAALIGCAGEDLHALESPQPTSTPSAVANAPTALPMEAPSAEPMPEPSAAPSAEKKPPPAAGRPLVQMGPSKKIAHTFGSTPGSVLKLSTKDGDFTLKLAEGALKTGTNFTFETPAKTRGKPPVVGDTVHLATQLGEESQMSEIDSAGPPFIIVVPSKKKVNLAICTMVLNEHGQETDKTKPCTVVAPTRFDEGLSQVVFEMTHLGPCVMYATTADETK